MRLDDVLKEFIYDCQLRKLSERTIKGFRNNNLRMFQFLENEFKITELEDVRNLHIRAYISHLSESGKKETYVNGLIKCFRAFFCIVKMKTTSKTRLLKK